MRCPECGKNLVKKLDKQTFYAGEKKTNCSWYCSKCNICKRTYEYETFEQRKNNIYKYEKTNKKET